MPVSADPCSTVCAKFDDICVDNKGDDGADCDEAVCKSDGNDFGDGGHDGRDDDWQDEAGSPHLLSLSSCCSPGSPETSVKWQPEST